MSLAELQTAEAGKIKRAWYKLGAETDVHLCLESVYRFSKVRLRCCVAV